MKETEYEYKMRYFGIRSKFELLERYENLLEEVKELREYKTISRKRYEKMNKTLMTYMDKYGSLDNKKGKNNGVYK